MSDKSPSEFLADLLNNELDFTTSLELELGGTTQKKSKNLKQSYVQRKPVSSLNEVTLKESKLKASRPLSGTTIRDSKGQAESNEPADSTANRKRVTFEPRRESLPRSFDRTSSLASNRKSIEFDTMMDSNATKRISITPSALGRSEFQILPKKRSEFDAMMETNQTRRISLTPKQLESTEAPTDDVLNRRESKPIANFLNRFNSMKRKFRKSTHGQSMSSSEYLADPSAPEEVDPVDEKLENKPPLVAEQIDLFLPPIVKEIENGNHAVIVEPIMRALSPEPIPMSPEEQDHAALLASLIKQDRPISILSYNSPKITADAIKVTTTQNVKSVSDEVEESETLDSDTPIHNGLDPVRQKVLHSLDRVNYNDSASETSFVTATSLEFDDPIGTPYFEAMDQTLSLSRSVAKRSIDSLVPTISAETESLEDLILGVFEAHTPMDILLKDEIKEDLLTEDKKETEAETVEQPFEAGFDQLESAENVRPKEESNLPSVGNLTEELLKQENDLVIEAPTVKVDCPELPKEINASNNLPLSVVDKVSVEDVQLESKEDAPLSELGTAKEARTEIEEVSKAADAGLELENNVQESELKPEEVEAVASTLAEEPKELVDTAAPASASLNNINNKNEEEEDDLARLIRESIADEFVDELISQIMAVDSAETIDSVEDRLQIESVENYEYVASLESFLEFHEEGLLALPYLSNQPKVEKPQTVSVECQTEPLEDWMYIKSLQNTIKLMRGEISQLVKSVSY